MRALLPLKVLAVALLAACASTPPAAPDARVRGCWISREGEIVRTMRWLPDGAYPGQIVGALNVYEPNGAVSLARYSLAAFTDANWRFCELDGGRCWLVAQGGAGSLEGGRVFIDAHREHLRIELVRPDSRELIFEGDRDGCD